MQLGSYAIEGLLGRGGMGSVYRARHGPTGAWRAVKVLESPDAELVARFRREAEALARLGPEVAVAVHETGVANGRFWFAMDLLAGGSLRERIKTRGRFATADAVALVARLARAVEQCHGLGLVHRDLKPENVLFDELDRPRLADFGCARDLAGAALSVTGTLLGTPAYMAPEQLLGLRSGPPADVYALGLILRELLTGDVPGGGKPLTALYEERRGAPLPLGLGALDAVLARALAPDPAQRLSANELAEALEGHAAPTAKPRVRGRPRLALPVAAALVLGAGAVVALSRIARAPREDVPRPLPLPSHAPPVARDTLRRVENAIASSTVEVTSATVPFAELGVLAEIDPEPRALALVANAGVVYRADDVEALAAAHPRSVAVATLAVLARLVEARTGGAAAERELAELAARPGGKGVALATDLGKLLGRARDVASRIERVHGEKGERVPRDMSFMPSAFVGFEDVLRRLPAPVAKAALAPLGSIATAFAYPGAEYRRRGLWVSSDTEIQRAMLEEALEPLRNLRDKLPPRVIAGIETSYPDAWERFRSEHVPQWTYVREVLRAASELETEDPLLAASAIARVLGPVALGNPEKGVESGVVLAARARALVARPFEGEVTRRWALLIRHEIETELGGVYRGILRTEEPDAECRALALVQAREAWRLSAELGATPERPVDLDGLADLVGALLENGREAEVTPEMFAALAEDDPLRFELARRQGAFKPSEMQQQIETFSDNGRRWNGLAVCVRAHLDAGRFDLARRSLSALEKDLAEHGVKTYPAAIEVLRLDRLRTAVARAAR